MSETTKPQRKDRAVSPPLPAASIVLIRDSEAGIETFMLQRHQGSGIAFSGATVFPGGKVDAEDSHETWRKLAAGVGAAPPLAFWIAAVRETFEEAGLLLARKPGSDRLLDASDLPRLVNLARDAGDGAAEAAADGFLGMIRREGLSLAIEHMVHFAHWITPAMVPKRFDTHFFLVGAPPEQTAVTDMRESESGIWLTPRQVLDEARTGARSLVPVTRFTLELLETWPSVAYALTEARSRSVVTVLPEISQTPEGRLLRIPKEAGYLTSELLTKA